MHSVAKGYAGWVVFFILLGVSALGRTESEYDMFRASPLPGQSMVLLDLSKAMQSHLPWVKQVFQAYAHSNEEALKRTGLATYGHEGAQIRVPVGALDGNHRTHFLQTLDTLAARETSSLLEGLLEIGHYYAGREILGRYEASPLKAEPLRYQAPVDEGCSALSKNELASPARDVLLVIAQNTKDSAALSERLAGVPLGVRIHRFLSGNPVAEGFHPQCPRASGGEGDVAIEQCTLAMVEHLHTHLGFRLSVVAMGHDNPFLAKLAVTGGGLYRSVAVSPASLPTDETLRSLQQLLEATLPPAIHTVLPDVQPVISHSLPMQTRLGETTLLTAQFQPMASPHWWGNVKRYGIQAEYGHASFLVGQHQAEPEGVPRLQSNAWILKDWRPSALSDERVVTRGGLAETRPSLDRQTAFVFGSASRFPLVPAGSLAALSADQRQLVALMARLYGWQGDALPTETEHPLVLKALQRYHQFAGLDSGGSHFEALRRLGLEPRQEGSEVFLPLGAPVFGSPLLVNYHASPDTHLNVLWWSGTDGLLRSVDAETGKWLTSVLPAAIIPRMLAAEMNLSGETVSGLDTSLVALKHDHDQDGVIQRSSGDYVYLYAGLRRGGSQVLALDVTEPDSPKPLFDITSSTPGFEALSDAWSTPILVKMRLPGMRVPQTVLVFGGGYDNRHESPVREAGACNAEEIPCGAAIYVVQASGAEAGRLLWSFDRRSGVPRHTRVPGMSSPITATLRAIDLDGDGMTDYLYALDLDGKLFRIRVPSAVSGKDELGVNDEFDVAMVATLGSANGDRDDAFFHPPSIALANSSEQDPMLVIALGSGRVTQPFSSRKPGGLYILTDTPARSSSSVPLSVDAGDAVTLEQTSRTPPSDKRLWILPALDDGEKLMSPPVILDHKAFFTTYRPPLRSQQTGCSSALGMQRRWGVDIRTGKPVSNRVDQSEPEVRNPYAGPSHLPLMTRSSPLLYKDQLYLLEGLNAIPVGQYHARPERLRWQQVLVGPRVRQP